MKKVIFVLVMLMALSVPVSAMEFQAPDAPEAATPFMPNETEDFFSGLSYILGKALDTVRPSIMEAIGTCIALTVITLLVGLLSVLSTATRTTLEITGTVTAAILLFQATNSLIYLGTENVQQISQYGTILLPVLTSALAAQGGVTMSGILYAGTAFFNAILSTGISKLLVPLIYIYLCITVACNLFAQPLLTELQKFLKWLMTWGLKIILYVFTGYISITGVVSGATDATLLKATKLTISGMVPVVGNILSDASEAVLVSAGLMKNASGIYGLLVVISMWIGPFIRIGTQYLLLKVTAGIGQSFGAKQTSNLVKDVSSAMGIVLAMCGAVCLMFLISVICFMKGVNI